MKFQPTCRICFSKIRIVDLRIGSRRRGPGRKLLCKHVFHASCIDRLYKRQCPLCKHTILNRDEEALLTCTSDKAAVDILKHRDINIKSVFTFLTSDPSAKYQWIVDLMYKYCDFTELLADNLNDKTLVKDILARGKVNWFKTFCGGLTFFDLVYERTDDPEIIALVHAKLPMPPELTYQRHRLTDSMSSAGSLRPNIERRATVRRSIPRPSLMTHTHAEESVDQPKTYPIYGRLYPVIPSAPPIEL